MSISRSVLLVALVLGAGSTSAQQPGKACALATASEIEAAIGKPAQLSAATLGDVEMCSGKAGSSSVMIRHFKRTSDPGGDQEKAGIEAAKKMGAKVDVKKSGPITCVAMSSARGHSTSCSVAKPPLFAVIEASNPKEAVPIDRLLPVAEKMAKRF